VQAALRLLQEVGLGYLTLGQRSPSLSGGEAQRIKLVTELAQATGAVLYVLDEPTVGLPWRTSKADPRAAPAGGLRQHGHRDRAHLDVIAEADWIIDLGRKGSAGGRIVAAGPPAAVARRTGRSHTRPASRRFWPVDRLRRRPSREFDIVRGGGT